VLLQLGINDDFLDKLEEGFCRNQYSRDGVYHR
jgi:hypothetical protein